MIIDFSKLTMSDYAAWWGAVIATSAFIWNIIVAVRSGARVRVRVTSNMRVYPTQPITGDKYWVSVTAINVGTSPTTITHCCGYYASSLWNLIKGKKQTFIINIDPRLGSKIPKVLSPGEEWSNLADQEGLKENNPKGYYYLGIIHNQKKRPIYKRFKFEA